MNFICMNQQVMASFTTINLYIDQKHAKMDGKKYLTFLKENYN